MGIPIIGNLVHRITSVATGATPSDATGRPEPLLDLANVWGPVHGLAAAGITAAATLGVLSAKNAATVNKGLGAADVVMAGVASLLAGLTPVLSAQSVASIGRTLVTPVADPQTR